jgi:hypothetical protein
MLKIGKNNQKIIILILCLVLSLLIVASHYIPLATKDNDVCGHGEVFEFSLLAIRDGGLDDYRHFHDFVSSFGSGICEAPEKAKLYLW